MIAELDLSQAAPVSPPPAEPPSEAPPRQLTATISASRLGCWLQCRLKFYFRYVARIAKPNTPALHIGSVAHLVLQQWNLARWRREPFHIERFQALFESHWTELQKEAKIDWEGEEEAERTTSWAALEHYFHETPIPADEKPEGVEVYVETDLAQHGLNTLVGVLDLVRADGRIVDFKNSGKTPDAEQALHQHEIQLTCYGLLYRDATGRTESGFELHHLVRTKTPKFVLSAMGPVTGEQQTRLFRQIESYLVGVEAEDYVPSPSFGCAGCEFFPECHAWH